MSTNQTDTCHLHQPPPSISQPDPSFVWNPLRLPSEIRQLLSSWASESIPKKKNPKWISRGDAGGGAGERKEKTIAEIQGHVLEIAAKGSIGPYYLPPKSSSLL